MISVPPKHNQQSEKFIAAAREAECDESEAAFDAKLKKLAATKLESEKPKGP